MNLPSCYVIAMAQGAPSLSYISERVMTLAAREFDTAKTHLEPMRRRNGALRARPLPRSRPLSTSARV